MELFDMESKSDNPGEIRIDWDEHERLDSLRHITFLIVNNGLESEMAQKTIKEHNKKFGSLPDELLELIEQRK